MERTKYPRTFNLPWSGSETSDDVWCSDCRFFEGKEVVVTEKIDGENTTIYPDGHTHARSVDSKHHPSRSWLKQYASTFAYQIPETLRICGENVFAYHSIFYDGLPSYFLVFGIYDDKNRCLAWDEVEDYCELLGLYTVPVLYRGPWDEKLIREMWTGKGTYGTYETESDQPSWPDDFTSCEAEGYVVRITGEFDYQDFRTNCAKYVRPNHVRTSSHWMEREPVINRIQNV